MLNVQRRFTLWHQMKPHSIAFLLALTCVSAPGYGEDTLFVQVPATLDPTAPIGAKVKEECAIEARMGNYAASEIGKQGFDVQPLASMEQAGDKKFVRVTILKVQGRGGGSWSGAKSMTIRVDLRQGQAVLASTVLSRSSRGGVFSVLIGTCAIFDRDAAVLGKDLAKWLDGVLRQERS